MARWQEPPRAPRKVGYPLFFFTYVTLISYKLGHLPNCHTSGSICPSLSYVALIEWISNLVYRVIGGQTNE